MSDLALFAGVAAAGAIGAPARYLLDGLARNHGRTDLPWGTLAVNVSGSFLLGLVTALALHRAFPETPTVLLGAGFCGAFTTFSTFAFETVRLAERAERGRAVLNVVITVGGGVVAAAAGFALVR
jgi:CrcB protein